MARSANSNYTASGTAFEKATAGSDPFEKGDVQLLAEAVDGHTHESGRGLPIKRLSNGVFASRPAAGNAGHVYITTNTDQAFFDDGAEWLEIPFLAKSKTWTAVQVFQTTGYPIVVASNDAGATGPGLALKHDSVSPAASDQPGYIDVIGKDSAAADAYYSRIQTFILDTTAGAQDGQLSLYVAVNGSLVETLKINSSGVDVAAGSLTVGGATPPSTQVLLRDFAEQEVVSSLAETTVFTGTVPGGTLSTNKGLRIGMTGQYFNNSGSVRDFTVRVKYGGVLIGIAAWSSIAADVDVRSFKLETLLTANGATNSQRAHTEVILSNANANVGSPPASSATADDNTASQVSAHNGAAVDSTSDQTLEITVQHSASNASLSFKQYAAWAERL